MLSVLSCGQPWVVVTVSIETISTSADAMDRMAEQRRARTQEDDRRAERREERVRDEHREDRSESEGSGRRVDRYG
jgi:hypothetical protein